MTALRVDWRGTGPSQPEPGGPSALPDGRLEGAAASWSAALVEAVNRDNEAPACRCDQSSTGRHLETSPAPLQAHAALALADLAAAGRAPLTELRSDVVATSFTTVGRATNVLVARMTVPGGPWPGHFGLEAIVFGAVEASWPRWFPPVERPYPLHLGHVLAASNGFAMGQGGVVFPEMLAVTRPVESQAFGVVFIYKLANLYLERVRPVLSRVGLQADDGGFDGAAMQPVRQLAFIAHEWGHLSGPWAPDSAVRARRRRLVAIISELHADLAAVCMLIDRGSGEALSAAGCLVLDRIVRDAWLPRARSQVDSVAARHLHMLLVDLRAYRITERRFELRLDAVVDGLRRELDVVTEVLARCLDGMTEGAHRYLGDRGWVLSTNRYQVSLDDQVSVALRAAAGRV